MNGGGVEAFFSNRDCDPMLIVRDFKSVIHAALCGLSKDIRHVAVTENNVYIKRTST